MHPETARCIVCEQDSHSVPLIAFDFKGKSYGICPQDLPILIHKPASLADKLPGLERIAPPKHE
ncbi:MAG: hypothetical protein A2W36_06800 [Chloroflexi bacterium RBG_16_58_14]|nr:MAG: hypothetical protein A2W36_06800 [Chloroflexi bacterium RBG_16_58_14]